MLSLRLFIWKTFTSAFCSDAYITIQTSGKIISTVPHRIPLPHVSCHISVYKITMQYHYYRCAKTVNSPVHFSSICNRTQITLGLIVLNSENSHLLESKPQNLDWYSRFSTGMWLTGRHTEHTTSVATDKCTPYMWCSLLCWPGVSDASALEIQESTHQVSLQDTSLYVDALWEWQNHLAVLLWPC